MATGEQFYINNPSTNLLNFVFLQLTGNTLLYKATFAQVDVNSGGPYASDGGVTGQSNFLSAFAFDFLAPFHAQAATAMVDQSFFIAPFPLIVVGITEIHAVAETTAATLRAQVTKDVSTDAPGAGTDLLTNTGGAGFDMKATANTLQTGALVAVSASLTMAAGDRLSVDFSAAATELVGVTIEVYLQRV